MAWPIKTVDEAAVDSIATALHINPVLARLLVLRGLATPDETGRFLLPRLADLYPYGSMPDIDKALARIRTAIERKQKVLVWGHDDLDGASSVALLVDTIAELGGVVSFYIPDKTREPHGLNRRRLEQAGRDGVGLVITTDCGITNRNEIRFARELGIDTVVTDHHELNGDRPEAWAVVDPKRPDSAYPFTELAGAGVALKLGMALRSVSGTEIAKVRPELLAWAALGTIADRVRLVDENRIVVKYGLRVLAESSNPSLRALCDTIGLPVDSLTVERIGREVIPVFTAIEAQKTVQFLLERNYQSAVDFLTQAISRVSNFKDEGKLVLENLERQVYLADNLVVAYDPHIPIRHLGFITTKLRNRFLMPTLVMTERGDVWVGELRGYEGDDLLGLLNSIGNYLLEYGGHKRACGFSIREADREIFLHRAQEYARVNFHAYRPPADRVVDGILPLAQLDQSFQQLSPLGPGNAEPELISPSTALRRRDGGWAVADNPALVVVAEAPIVPGTGPVDIVYKFDDQLKVTIVECKTNEPGAGR